MENKYITLAGKNERINFDKVLLAWGTEKNKLGKPYSNVFYLEDQQSHARIHNEIIKAKQVVVLGGTMEAYQIAASVRDYLDSIGQTETKIMLLHNDHTEISINFGGYVASSIHELYKQKRISVIRNAKI